MRARESARDGGGRGHADVFVPLFVLAGLLTLKLFAARVLALGDANPLRAVVLEGPFVVFALALLALALPRTPRLWAWLGVDAVVTLLAVAIVIFTGEFEQAPTLDALRVAGELPAVGGAVGALFRPAYWLFLADIPLLAALLAATARRRSPQPRVTGRPIVITAAVAGLASLLAIGLVLGQGAVDDTVAGARSRGLLAFGLFAPSEEAGGGSIDAPATGTGNAPESPAKARTAPPRTTVSGKVDFKDPADVQARFDGLQEYTGSGRIPGAAKPGTARGHSVVMVQAEALATWVIGLKVDGAEVTPNMNRLVATSWYAPRMVTQIGRGNTSDAEFTANTSLLADRKMPSAYVYGDRRIPSLPRLAANAGYSTATLHTNVIRYWRRDKLYPALGFGTWYAGPDFPQRDVIGVGPSDAVLYEKALAVIASQRSSGKPFLTEIVALSAHFPYYDAAPHGKLAVPKGMEWTVLGEYLRAMHYQDEQLGAFIERLRRDGVWDDAIVVVYGDHFGVRPFGASTAAADDLGKKEREWLGSLLGRAPAAADNYLVPFVMHLPGQAKAHTVGKVRAQVDIFPTLADVLGFDMSATPRVGASIFDDRPRRVQIRYHAPAATFLDDEVLFRPGKGYKDAKVLRLSDSAKVNVSIVPEDRYKRMHALSSFTDAYLRALPKR